MGHALARLALPVVLAVLCLQPPPADARRRAKRSRPKATFYVNSRGKTHVRTVAESLERALSSLAQVDFNPIRHLLEPVGPALEKLGKANEQAIAGRELLANLEVQRAVGTMEQAVELQEKAFHLQSVSESGVAEHAGLLAELAMAYFLAGDEQRAKDTLQRAFVLLPTMDYNENKFPPQMKRIFDEVRFLMDELGQGRAKIVTRPGRAEIRVNGNFVGFSPTQTAGLVAGRNLVTLSKPGYTTQTVPLQIQGGTTEAQLNLDLRPVKGNPARLLAAAMREAVSGAPPRALRQAAARLGVGVLFLATTVSRDDLVTVHLYTYDARRNKLSSRNIATISALDPDSEAKGVAETVVPFLSPPTAKSVVRKRPSESWFSRVRRWRYFWPVVGAAAGLVVIGTSVGVGVYYGTRDKGDDRAKTLVILPGVRTGYAF